jgi:MtrB/PioB family decaheme-associated outer membrane protein
MTMRVLGVATLTVAVLLGGAELAAAQYTLGGMGLEGEVETGARFFLEEPSKTRSAKFQEYRDVDDGLFLQRFSLRAFTSDDSYSTELAGSEWGSENQNFSLSAGRLGLWQFNFEWDQLRHVLFTNTRLLATETDRGVFLLGTPRPALTAHNAAPERDDLSVRWDTARLGFRYSFTPDFDMKAEYTRIRKDGDRPFGMGFGSPGNNFYEVLEPIEHTIHDFRLQGTYATERWQIVFGYTGSVFVNDQRRVLADNPCFGNPAGQCGAGDGGAAAVARGQSSLPPSNMAHTLSLGGGVNLPLRTRINANFTYSLRLQDDSFLPHTINDAFRGDPDLVLPEKSLNGKTHVVALHLNGTTRPWSAPVTLSGKYRLYQQIEDSERPAFPAVVVNDRSITRDVHRAARLDYTRHNVDVEGRYQVTQPLALLLGTGWERWDRSEGREVGESDEFFGKAGIDAALADWMQARLTYRPSYRRYAHYDPFSRLHTITVEDDLGELSSQSVFLRKFDQAERDRQQVDVSLTLTPLETVTVTPTFAYRWDDYIASRLGLQKETSWSSGIDVNFTPSQWFSVSAGYIYEKLDQTQRQRYRASGAGGTTTDFKDYEWISENTDTIQTAHLSARGAIVPRLLEWAVGANWSYALGRVDTNNPVPPVSGTAANNVTATAKPWPAFEDQLVRLDAALKYHITKAWTATIGYAWESFEQHDWRTDNLTPFVPVPSAAGVPGQTSIWLGNDVKNYTAHIIGASIAYRFK